MMFPNAIDMIWNGKSYLQVVLLEIIFDLDFIGNSSGFTNFGDTKSIFVDLKL